MLYAWNTSNCTGTHTWTEFSDTVLARNISNWQISRSFKLSRPLQGQEQLDLSEATNVSSWYHNADQLSYNSSSCTRFLQTYYASNGTTTCHSTPPFTCHRLWNNPGLAEAWIKMCLSVQALIGIDRWNATNFRGLKVSPSSVHSVYSSNSSETESNTRYLLKITLLRWETTTYLQTKEPLDKDECFGGEFMLQ
jgi:hypothetical protein